MRQEIQRVIRNPEFTSEYRILSQEGEGGMGMVFKAIQVSLNRTVAVKILLPSLFSDADVARRLEREAQLTADLKKHENIVRLLGFGRVSDLPYVVYEFVEGQTLAAVIRREAPLPISRAVDLIAQLLEGLAHAHDHRIIHRDVKPDNLLIDKFNNLKVMDFGIALAESTQERLTQEGLIIGTPVYMAPEQAQGRGVSALVDLYATGVVLYELLSAKLPWVQESPMALLAEKVGGRFIPILTAAPGVPAALAALIDGAIHPDPRRRPRDAREFRRQLEAAAGELRDSELDAAPVELATDRIELESAPPAPLQTRLPTRPSARVAAARPLRTLMSRFPPALLAQIAGAGLVMAGVVIGGLYLRYSEVAGSGAEITFTSVSASRLPDGSVRVTWIYPRDVEAEAELYAGDVAAGGEPMRRPMVRDESGRYQAEFELADLRGSYYFKVNVPNPFGQPVSSEPRRLEGFAELAETLEQEIERVGLEKLAREALARRSREEPGSQVSGWARRQLAGTQRLVEKLSALAPAVWKDGTEPSPAAAGLVDALARLELLEWKLAELDAAVDLHTGALIPPAAATARAAMVDPAVECRLVPAAPGQDDVPLRTPRELALQGCALRPGPAAQLAVTLEGRTGGPYYVAVRVDEAPSFFMRGEAGPGTVHELVRNFDGSGLSSRSRFTIELRRIPSVARVAPSPGLRFTRGTLRIR